MSQPKKIAQNKLPQPQHSDFGDLLKDSNQMSMISAVTRDPKGGNRPHVVIKPPPHDPDFSKALASSLVVQLFKLVSGVCCTGMEGNYANQMINKKMVIE